MTTEKIRIEQHSFMGSLWFGGWLFTIGFLQLTFWKGVLKAYLIDGDSLGIVVLDSAKTAGPRTAKW